MINLNLIPNFFLIHLLNVKFVFKANMSKHLFILSQGILNPSNWFIAMCVTQTEFSPEAAEDTLWHSLTIISNSVTPIFLNLMMKFSICSRCINPKLRINLTGRSRSDRRREYTSNHMTEYYQEHDIIHDVAVPYTPQSNGVAEWKNRILIDLINCMLLSLGALENF